MRNLILQFSLFLFTGLSLGAQTKNLEFVLKDQRTLEPIVGAHVFVLNSSYGTISGPEGEVLLQLPLELKEQLVISHIAYENHFIPWKDYQSLDTSTEIILQPNGLSLDEITIVGKRDKQWKKNYKRFQQAFLGNDKAAKKTEILNPEVLRFEMQDGHLIATAVDLIKITNNYLGYEIDFLLKDLVVQKDGSSQYRGFAKFTDLLDSKNVQKLIVNRSKTFKSSRRHFLKSLIDGHTLEDNYALRFLEYNNAAFHLLAQPDPDSIVTYDANSETYHLWFDQFLEVQNKNIKKSNTRLDQGGKIVPMNQYAGASQSKNNSQQYIQSMLYKLTPFLALDKHGHILNENSVKEYGFWAEQRVAHLLPWDYGIQFSKSKDANQVDLSFFKLLLYGTPEEKVQVLDKLDQSWEDAYIPLLLEVVRLSGDNNLTNTLQELINKKIGNDFKGSFYTSLEHVWKSPENILPIYSDFKAEIYQHIDPKFLTYFKGRQESSNIRLDEILWGGVVQDGIPPLRFPKMISAKEANYLDDDNIIFGFSINGVVRAYPKRILAWHEFFVDSFGDLDIAGVYCTLCGTVIAYDMTHDGVRHDLGTSGFLYRSNKLMYDKATQSLWNTIEGKPVLGPLSNKNIQLETYPVVTTTWGAWKKIHPETEVLSLKTGHARNYDEGNAYNKYYATDNLMFPVPVMDDRLANKQEVFIVRVDNYRTDPHAFSKQYLKSNRVIKAKLTDTDVTILTDKSGASRAYASQEYSFKSFSKMSLKDDSGVEWMVDENGIHSPSGISLPRLPAHEIFWFAWINSYPNTVLIK